MKMETVIRSPQKGVVAKLVHKEGVSRFSWDFVSIDFEFMEVCWKVYANESCE